MSAFSGGCANTQKDDVSLVEGERDAVCELQPPRSERLAKEIAQTGLVEGKLSPRQVAQSDGIGLDGNHPPA
jgi:hypothetical protein